MFSLMSFLSRLFIFTFYFLSCQAIFDKDSVSKIYKEFLQWNNKNTNKNGQRTSIAPKKYIYIYVYDQQAHEKMLNIISH